MRADVFPTDPLRARALKIRKQSLLRQYAANSTSVKKKEGAVAMPPFSSSQDGCSVRESFLPNKRTGRRFVRFAPFVDVYEISLPDDFTLDEYHALWMNRDEHEEAKKEFAEVIMALQTDLFDSADLLLDENNLPEDHPLQKYCVRGCEKYFDLSSRFRVRHVVSERILAFHRRHQNHPESLRRYAMSLTAECADLAYWHGKLNALQCWGTTLHKYHEIQRGISRRVQIIAAESPPGLPFSDSYGIEVVLKPSYSSRTRFSGCGITGGGGVPRSGTTHGTTRTRWLEV